MLAEMPSLPTFTNLEKKKVNIENKCTFCLMHNEDLVHAQFMCKDLWPMWKHYVPTLSTISEVHNFSKIISWLLHNGFEHEFTRWLVFVGVYGEEGT